MEASLWIAQEWLSILNAVGVVGGLLFTGFSFRADAKARRLQNLLTITEHHRDIWTHFLDHPELGRVLAPDVDLRTQPVTEAERTFVTLFILHLNAVFHASRDGVYRESEGANTELKEMFSRPVFAAVWNEIRPLQDVGFLKFIAACTAARN